MKKFIPIVLAVLMLGWVLSGMVQKSEAGFHFREFGKLPILSGGRYKPFDALARTSLLQIRTRQSVSWKENGHWKTMSATEWLVEVMMKPFDADDRPIFRIDNNEVLALLKLPDNQKYFSFRQIMPGLDEINRQAERIEGIEAAKRTVFETQLMKLDEALNLYQRLQVTLKPPATDDFAAELDAYQKNIVPGIEALKAREAGKKYDEKAFNILVNLMTGYKTVSQYALALTIPPEDPHAPPNAWQNIGTNLMQTARTGEINPAAKDYAAMVTAYRADAPADFNQAVTAYRVWLADRYTPQLHKASLEFFFSNFEPFYKAMVIYILALVAALIYLLFPAEWLRKSAFYWVLLALVIHTIGIAFRVYLEGRPPVTNLYSSAVFIGWAIVVLSLVLEKIYPIGIGLLAGSCAGFSTQIIAHHLGVGGDTMEMMRAVLDTNFWLTTHVLSVTLGYASTFLAGLLAIVYIAMGLFTKRLAEPWDTGTKLGKIEIGKVMAKMVYGIICFATLFSFTGTVLGGIWADQSWGRFWGWDPKENGALLIVLWNAMILHARWGGLVRDRGLMNLAIVGNIVTSWSWFGVNMLGIGLHSYGFTDAAFRWLMIFVGSQVAIIIVGLTPLDKWRSFQKAGGSAAAKP
ncbi:MAG TPA: cytochrome c biogenesis protein CcsA [Desulfuromonadaceae bacterium]|nr:cytochrome c biogenesis protein CcsA [Desulfuromonadaceae bacterium]